MKHILVIADPLGGEQLAFQKAVGLAQLTVADVHVVTFCHEPYAELQSNYLKNKSGAVDLKQLVIDHTDNAWHEFVEGQTLSVKVSQETVWEKYIHKWILEHCKSVHYDLVVKTGHRTESLLYTPTDWQLFRELNVPIYCLYPGQATAGKVILVALDLMTDKREKQQLNDRLLEEAFKLSVQTNSVLHCCYAVDIPVVATDLDLIDSYDYVKQADARARQESKASLELYDIDDEHLHIKMGRPWQVLKHYAEQLDAQCIVIGSAGRKGIAGKLIGNTAEKVIHSIETDLLVI